MTASGQVVLLNGAASAGKTTLAHALQRIWPGPLQHIALDQFRDGMAGRYRGMNSRRGEPGARGLNVVPMGHAGARVTELRFGDVGRAILRGMRRAAAAFAEAGLDVVIDDLLLEREFLLDYLAVFAEHTVVFVAVRCDLATLNAREARRLGRFPGTAAAHVARVHRGRQYDVQVDTATTAPGECAAQVMAAAQARRCSAFVRMRAAVAAGTTPGPAPT